MSYDWSEDALGGMCTRIPAGCGWTFTSKHEDAIEKFLRQALGYGEIMSSLESGLESYEMRHEAVHNKH